MKSVREIAESLVAHCRAGTEREGLNTLYAEDAVSVEAMAMPGADSAAVEGRAAIQAKHDWWDEAMEVHDATIEGPYYHSTDRFAVIFKVDATDKVQSKRARMEEVGIYTVADGKIVREEFFYDA